MTLPVAPPVEPMLAKLADAVPEGDGWLYEPKWDGFRTLVFRDGDDVYLQSRDLEADGPLLPRAGGAAAGRACRRAPCWTARS